MTPCSTRAAARSLDVVFTVESSTGRNRASALSKLRLPNRANAESRSEERRVGKECRSQWRRYEHKKKRDRIQGHHPAAGQPGKHAPQRTAADAAHIDVE